MTLAFAPERIDTARTKGKYAKKRKLRARTCSICKKIEHIRSDSPATMCRPCASRVSAAKLRGRPPGWYKPNYELCRHCRRVFVASPSNKQKYCNRDCLRAAKSVERTCVTCGKKFRVARSILSEKTNSSGRFCSRPCYERHLCRTDRITGRGSRWNAIRREARRLTPFCAFCGKTDRLQVHHIIPFRLTQDNSQTNLIPLCLSCHKRVESVFHDLEAIDPPLPTTKLILFCAIQERRTLTFHRLKGLAADARNLSAA